MNYEFLARNGGRSVQRSKLFCRIEKRRILTWNWSGDRSANLRVESVEENRQMASSLFHLLSSLILWCFLRRIINEDSSYSYFFLLSLSLSIHNTLFLTLRICRKKSGLEKRNFLLKKEKKKNTREKCIDWMILIDSTSLLLDLLFFFISSIIIIVTSPCDLSSPLATPLLFLLLDYTGRRKRVASPLSTLSFSLSIHVSFYSSVLHLLDWPFFFSPFSLFSSFLFLFFSRFLLFTRRPQRCPFVSLSLFPCICYIRVRNISSLEVGVTSLYLFSLIL